MINTFKPHILKAPDYLTDQKPIFLDRPNDLEYLSGCIGKCVDLYDEMVKDVYMYDRFVVGASLMLGVEDRQWRAHKSPVGYIYYIRTPINKHDRIGGVSGRILASRVVNLREVDRDWYIGEQIDYWTTKLDKEHKL